MIAADGHAAAEAEIVQINGMCCKVEGIPVCIPARIEKKVFLSGPACTSEGLCPVPVIQ